MITGSAVVGAIVQTPEPLHPAPDTLNAIVSEPALLLACVIASRSDPAPESVVLVTVKVGGGACGPKGKEQGDGEAHWDPP